MSFPLLCGGEFLPEGCSRQVHWYEAGFVVLFGKLFAGAKSKSYVVCYVLL